MSFVRQQVLEWAQAGFIVEVSKPDLQCISPLTVAERYSHTSRRLKYRVFTSFHLSVKSYLFYLSNVMCQCILVMFGLFMAESIRSQKQD